MTLSSEGVLAIDTDGIAAINIGIEAAAKTITIGNDASTKVDVNALAIELDSVGAIALNGTSLTFNGTALSTGGFSNFKNNTGNFIDSLFLGTNGTPTLDNTTTGCINNIIISDNSLNALTTGKHNIIVGNTTASAITDGSRNTFIGHNSGSIHIKIGALGATTTHSSIFDLENTTNVEVGHFIRFTLGDNKDEVREITVISSNTITVSPAFTSTAQTSGNTYVIEQSIVASINNTAIGSNTQFTSITELTGTLDASTPSSTTSFILSTSPAPNVNDDFYNDKILRFTGSGNNAGESRIITDYVGDSRTITVSPAFTNNGSDSDAFIIEENVTNQNAFGFGAKVNVNNEISLGNSSITTLRCSTNTITSFSDRRDKINIVDSTLGLPFINNIRPREFVWNMRSLDNNETNNPKNGRSEVGFIAQEIQDSMTNNENHKLHIVNTNNPNRLEVSQGSLIPVLVKAIQDLSTANDTLVARVSALENN